MSASPAPRPCGSCPYRRDVPSGLWDAVEYDKLPAYDRPTMEQPPQAFYCHQQDGRLCAGWVGCHDMGHNLAMRFGRGLSLAEHVDVMVYTTDVPLFASGAEAAEHGKRDVAAPGERALRIIGKLRDRRAQADNERIREGLGIGGAA